MQSSQYIIIKITSNNEKLDIIKKKRKRAWTCLDKKFNNYN